MSEMLLLKRATRGQRMTSLIGEAVEQDETFWGDGIWGESDDESFSEVEVEPDQFDSDFNDTEDEGGNSEDEEKAVKAAGDTEKSGGNANRYKEPAGKVQKKKHIEKGERSSSRNISAIKSSSSSVKKIRDPANVADRQSAFDTVRAVRQSTKEKTVDADVARRKAFKVKIKSRPPLRHQFSQRELLLDALDTETENQKWLEAQRLADYERAVGDKHAKVQIAESYIRLISKRSTYNTVTFSNTDCIPSVLTENDGPGPVPSKVRKQYPKPPKPVTLNFGICVITGLKAMYKDPLTNQPYANLTAFKEIRRQYAEFRRNNDPQSNQYRR